MECDFTTALPYNIDFKTDELDHLLLELLEEARGRMKTNSYWNSPEIVLKLVLCNPTRTPTL
jgi:hypothetical protein